LRDKTDHPARKAGKGIGFQKYVLVEDSTPNRLISHTQKVFLHSRLLRRKIKGALPDLRD